MEAYSESFRIAGEARANVIQSLSSGDEKMGDSRRRSVGFFGWIRDLTEVLTCARPNVYDEDFDYAYRDKWDRDREYYSDPGHGFTSTSVEEQLDTERPGCLPGLSRRRRRLRQKRKEQQKIKSLTLPMHGALSDEESQLPCSTAGAADSEASAEVVPEASCCEAAWESDLGGAVDESDLGGAINDAVEVLPEKPMEEILPESPTEEILPESPTEEVLPESPLGEVLPESMGGVLPESMEEVLPEKPMEEPAPPRSDADTLHPALPTFKAPSPARAAAPAKKFATFVDVLERGLPVRLFRRGKLQDVLLWRDGLQLKWGQVSKPKATSKRNRLDLSELNRVAAGVPLNLNVRSSGGGGSGGGLDFLTTRSRMPVSQLSFSLIFKAETVVIEASSRQELELLMDGFHTLRRGGEVGEAHLLSSAGEAKTAGSKSRSKSHRRQSASLGVPPESMDNI